MTRVLAAVVVLVVLGSTACGNKVTTPPDRFRAAESIARTPSTKEAQGAAPAATYWAAQRLIRTADMRIQVRDAAAAVNAADSIARSNESLLADSHTTQDADGKKTADVVLRVPTARFAGVLQALRSLGDVKQDGVSTQDVTKDYADLETRVAVKEQTVARLRGLLDSRSAKLSDVLDVERELSRAVAELEQMKGERRFYDQQIALSTIKLVLFERTPSRASQFSGPIADAFHNALDILGSSVGTLIYLVVAIAPWLVMALGVVWIGKRVRRQFTDGRSASD